jgi:hypothetical protein
VLEDRSQAPLHIALPLITAWLTCALAKRVLSSTSRHRPDVLQQLEATPMNTATHHRWMIALLLAPALLWLAGW